MKTSAQRVASNYLLKTAVTEGAATTRALVLKALKGTTLDVRNIPSNGYSNPYDDFSCASIAVTWEDKTAEAKVVQALTSHGWVKTGPDSYKHPSLPNVHSSVHVMSWKMGVREWMVNIKCWGPKKSKSNPMPYYD